MALAQTIAWDVQTGGTSTFGGGWNTASSGTDYSQSTSAHTVFNGTTVTATTSGISTIITITGYTVAAGDVGNILNITGGTNFTAGRYEITAQSGSTWTLDRNCTSGVGAAMTGNMGGCLDHPQTAMTAMTADQVSWVKAGTYNLTAALTEPSFGGVKYMTRVSGYGAAHNDKPTGASRPVFATNNNAINGITDNQNAGWRFENIILDGSGSTKGLVGISNTGGSSGNYFNVKVTGFASQGILASVMLNLNFSEVTACAATTGNGAVECTAGAYSGFGNWIHDNSKTGVYCPIINCRVLHHVISNNTGASSDGMNVTYSSTAIGNTLFANGRHGINNTDANGQLWGTYLNNLCVNNAGYGYNWNGTRAFTTVEGVDYNAFYNNTSGSYNGSSLNAHDVLLTGNPFTASGSNDFTLNATAGAGASARSAGAPGLLGAMVGYMDIGALRHQDAGGGTVSVFNVME